MKYIILNLYVLNRYEFDERFIKVLLKYQIFIIDNLRVKILININILISKNVDLVIFIYINYIENYRIIFNLTIVSLKLFIKREVRFKREITILTYFYITIFIENIKLFFDNSIFKSTDKYPVILFFVIINNSFHAILI